jgi:hypothetical protein
MSSNQNYCKNNLGYLDSPGNPYLPPYLDFASLITGSLERLMTLEF